jgi:hypothetical protein
MQIFRQALAASKSAILVFGIAAFILALVSGGNMDRQLVRIFIELPLLLVVALIGVFVINLAASAIATVAAGSHVVAAVVAAVLAWLIAAPPSFAGLGFHSLLRPAYAVATAVAWLIMMRRSPQRT